MVLYRIFAADLIRAFIHDPETVRYGTQILQARCFATPVMFLSFHMVHFMQAVKKGGVSFWLAFIRQLCLNIPLLLLLHSLYGMTGLVWTQASPISSTSSSPMSSIISSGAGWTPVFRDRQCILHDGNVFLYPSVWYNDKN